MDASIIALVVMIIGLGVMAVGMFRTSQSKEKESTAEPVPPEQSMYILQEKATGHLRSIDRTLKFFFWLAILTIVVYIIYWIMTPATPTYY